MKPARWTPWGRNTASSAEKGTLVSCFAWYETRWEAHVNLFCCMTETLVCCLSKYSCGPFSPLVTLIGEDKVNFRFSHNACFIHLSDPFNILEATNVIFETTCGIIVIALVHHCNDCSDMVHSVFKCLYLTQNVRSAINHILMKINQCSSLCSPFFVNALRSLLSFCPFGSINGSICFKQTSLLQHPLWTQ